MSLYLWIKLVHILSATVLFGTGLGTAFFMLRAYLSENQQAMAVTTYNVVLADWLFTTPAVVVQLVTGLWLMDMLNMSFASTWFLVVIGLYIFVGICWIPVVWIQIRIKNLVMAGANREEYTALMRFWVALGVPAFIGVLILFFLMVSKLDVYG